MDRDPRAGLTFLEILIVMTVFAILLGIALPSITSTLQETKTEGAAQRFASTHSLAKSWALRNGRQTQLHISAGSRTYWVEVTLAGGGTDTVGGIRNLDDDVMTMSSNRALLCFNGQGIPTTAGACEAGDATVIFTLRENADTVTMTRLGKVLR